MSYEQKRDCYLAHVYSCKSCRVVQVWCPWDCPYCWKFKVKNWYWGVSRLCKVADNLLESLP